jgi:DNA polymerase-3 subunit epsilon
MFGRFKGGRPGTVTIDARSPIKQVRYVAIDTELTGLDEKKDGIVSLGAVRMTGGTIHPGENFYRLVNPSHELRAESVVIHQITPSEVREQPDIRTALLEFFAFCGQDVLVGHFVNIDLCFFDRESKCISGKTVTNPVIDTISVYTWLRRRLPMAECFSLPETGTSLYDIARTFNIPLEGAHNALQDAFTTAQLLQRFLPMLEQAGATEIGDLLKIGIPFEGGDHHYRPTGEICNF